MEERGERVGCWTAAIYPCLFPRSRDDVEFADDLNRATVPVAVQAYTEGRPRLPVAPWLATESIRTVTSTFMSRPP